MMAFLMEAARVFGDFSLRLYTSDAGDPRCRGVVGREVRARIGDKFSKTLTVRVCIDTFENRNCS